MEKKKNDQSALSWCWNSHSDRHRSQWLQTTLSELDEKIKVIISIIEEDGDSFAKRAEMFYKRRPELIHVLEDLQKSYRSLADKYDQLRFSSTTTTTTQPFYSTTTSSSFSSLKSLRQVVHSSRSILNHNQQHLSEPPPSYDLQTETAVVVSEEEKKKKKKNEKIIGDDDDDDDDDDDEVMLELTEDHVRQLNELMRRNNEKRKTIKDLCCKINKLMIENRDLKKKCLASHDATDAVQVDKNTKPKLSQLPSSKFKGPSFFGKLTGCSG